MSPFLHGVTPHMETLPTAMVMKSLFCSHLSIFHKKYDVFALYAGHAKAFPDIILEISDIIVLRRMHAEKGSTSHARGKTGQRLSATSCDMISGKMIKGSCWSLTMLLRKTKNSVLALNELVSATTACYMHLEHIFTCSADQDSIASGLPQNPCNAQDVSNSIREENKRHFRSSSSQVVLVLIEA